MTRHFGLIGFPLGHSFSKKFFSEKFAAENIDAVYENYPIPHVNELPGIIGADPQLEGLNVTAPHKQAVIPLLDSLDPDSAAIGAVNVIRISRGVSAEPVLKGFNTDCAAFLDSLRPLLQGYSHSRALVLGTGGASAAVVHALRKAGIEPLKVSRFPGQDAIGYSDLDRDVVTSHTVIVNATPLGMYPHVDTFPPIPYRYITPQHVCYDLVYNPELTEFMRRCSARGAIVSNGLGMLHRQALASWLIWNSKTD